MTLLTNYFPRQISSKGMLVAVHRLTGMEFLKKYILNAVSGALEGDFTMNQESKRDKFVRIAEARTNKIISMVQLLGNCANPVSYEYTEKDVADIFNAIEKEIRAAKAKFTNTENKTSTFKLSR